MDRQIADSSVWIDFFNGVRNPQVSVLKESIENSTVYICSVIVQEILQGIRDDTAYEQCKEGLSAIPMLKANDWDAGVGAASIYRRLRKQGVTIRKPNDCVIAWYAMTFNLTLVHRDHDFELISTHLPLKKHSA